MKSPTDKLRDVIGKAVDGAGGNQVAAVARALMMAEADPDLSKALDEATEMFVAEKVAGVVMAERPDLADNLEALAAETTRRSSEMIRAGKVAEFLRAQPDYKPVPPFLQGRFRGV